MSDRSYQYNFEFKGGEKTIQPVASGKVHVRTPIEPDEVKRIVKWNAKDQGCTSFGL
jgi:hypothetical protein